MYGRLVADEVDPLAACPPGNENVPRVRDVDVVQEVDAAEAAGARSLLVHITLCGGHIAAAYRIAGRLREFAADVGRVVAFIDGQCDSCAPVVALAADFVAIDPRSWFGFHGAVGGSAEIAEREIAEIIASRSGMAIEHVAALQADGPEVVHRIYGAEAVRLGLADEISTLERAREIAAGAAVPETERARRLALTSAAPTPIWAGVTMSSESGFIGLPWVSTEQRAHELAMNNWTVRTVGAGAFSAITWTGSRFVAVGTNVCATSADGINWTTRTIPNGYYNAVASDGAGTVVAVGSTVCATSSDNGSTWTARTIGGGVYFAVAWDGGQFVAVGSNACATSPTGVTWTSRSFSGQAYGLAWTGSAFIAVGVNLAATSPDGLTWTARTMPTGTYRGVTHNETTLCAVGDAGACATSSDGGVTWTARSVPAAGGARWLSGIVWTNYTFLALEGTTGAEMAVSYLSADGVYWKANGSVMPVASGARGLAWNGNVACAIGLNYCATSLATA
jgi:ATP-dependent protease ClpP protease subunit